MYATERRQTRIIAQCPYPRGGGIIQQRGVVYCHLAYDNKLKPIIKTVKNGVVVLVR